MTTWDVPDVSGVAVAGPPSDYDLAVDLFGWPPRPRRVCPGCGDLAEPWAMGMCWCCCARRGLVPTVPAGGEV